MNNNLAYGGEEFDFNGLKFQLAMDGTLYMSSAAHEQKEVGKFESESADGNDKRPFIPKRKNFRSLMKWAIRDGDYDQELEELKEFRKEQRAKRKELKGEQK